MCVIRSLDLFKSCTCANVCLWPLSVLHPFLLKFSGKWGWAWPGNQKLCLLSAFQVLELKVCATEPGLKKLWLRIVRNDLWRNPTGQASIYWLLLISFSCWLCLFWGTLMWRLICFSEMEDLAFFELQKLFWGGKLNGKELLLANPCLLTGFLSLECDSGHSDFKLRKVSKCYYIVSFSKLWRNDLNIRWYLGLLIWFCLPFWSGWGVL